VARRYLAALEHDLVHLVAKTPHAFGWFHETGAPYRAKLFRLVRANYWIIYVVDDERQIVEFVRFWNAAREPATHGL
jgi:mRNA-degrading endonuclease RelE of RelBE toxin-antitoxin system